MTQMIVHFQLGSAGQKSALLAGLSGATQQTLAVSPSEPEFAPLLEFATINAAGVPILPRQWRADFAPDFDPEWDHVPTAGEILANLLARRERKSVARAAEREQATAATLAVLTGRTTRTATDHVEGVPFDYHVADWPYQRDESVVASPEAVTWVAELATTRDAIREQTRAAALAEQAARKAAAEQEAAAKEERRLALRAARGLEDGDVSLRVENGALAQVPAGCWESHPRGKNWLALIAVSPLSPGGLARTFAIKAKGEWCYLVPDWVPGTAVEFGADYYSGRGRKSPTRWYGYYVRSGQDADGVEYVVLHQCGTGKDACKEGAAYAQSPAALAIASVSALAPLAGEGGIPPTGDN